MFNKKSKKDEFSVYPKSLDELDDFAKYLGGFDKLPSDLDLFDKELNEYRKKTRFKNFVKSRSDDIKNFFSKNYSSFKKTLSPKILGVSLLAGLAVGGADYNKVDSSVQQGFDNVEFSRYVGVIYPRSVENMKNECYFVDELNNKQEIERNNLNNDLCSFVDRDFSREDFVREGKKRGLTGILEVVSSHNPSYAVDGNIHLLAKIAGVDLFNEDISGERGRIKSEYVGNNINDILNVNQIEKIYDVLLSKQNVDESKNMVAEGDFKIPLKEYTDSIDDLILSVRIAQSNNSKTLGTGVIKDLDKEKDELELPSRHVAYLRDPFNDELNASLSPKQYELVANKFNSHKNKYVALEDIASEYELSKNDVAREVFNSRNHADIKYSTYLKGEVSKEDAARLVNEYVNGSLKSAKEKYKSESGVDVSTNFYKALDDFSEKLGLGKIRKSKLDESQKKDVSSKLKKYA